MSATDIKTLLNELTLEEKIQLLAGVDIWHTPPIPRLGIGCIKTTDGPSGARGKFAVDGPKAAFVPGPVCQAATWSRSQILKLGRLLCREAKTKSAHVLLAPTICCARNPLGGRNFECFGEDPFLSGALAMEYVKGVQETGEVAATPKHFVANEQEHFRFSIDAKISEKALREIYLRPFEMVVRSPTPPECIMTAYNSVNGRHVDMNSRIIRDILREEWDFKGLIMSDWGGTNSTLESLMAGLDLEMPGPPERRGAKLVKAIEEDGSPDVIVAVDESVTKVLTLAKKRGLLGLTPEEAEKTRDSQETSSTTAEDIQLMREIAGSGMVLLKNDHKTLPLSAELVAGKQVAFIGPNALDGTPGGGGSATMNPQYLSRPAESFQKVAAANGMQISVNYSLGAYARKWLPLFSGDQWGIDEGQQVDSGKHLRVDYYSSNDLSGPIKETQYRGSSNIDVSDSSPLDFQVDPVPPYSFRVTSELRPQAAGTHTFSLSSVGSSKLFIDGELVIDNSDWKVPGETFYAFGSAEVFGKRPLDAGKKYTVTIEAWVNTSSQLDALDANHVFAAHPSVRIGYQEELPSKAKMIEQAIIAADESVASVIVLGLSDEWESEGYDRKSMDLPGDQDELVHALITRAKRPESLIFVNQSGSPVELPWIDKAGTFIQAWYGGQEAGNALADVLLGRTNPSGRLPFTWPVKYSDLPFAADRDAWPGVGGKVIYKEGSNVGYRWFSHNSSVAPLWWFGDGMSYTSFKSSILIVEDKGDSWAINVEVKNTGSLHGQEVVQLFSWPVGMPEEVILVAFEKTEPIRPGKFTTVFFDVRKRDVARWEDGKLVLRGGFHTLGVGIASTKATKETIGAHVKETSWKANEY